MVAGEVADPYLTFKPDPGGLPEVGRQHANGLVILLMLQRDQCHLAVDVPQLDVVVRLNEQRLALVLLHQMRERKANLIDVAETLPAGCVLV